MSPKPPRAHTRVRTHTRTNVPCQAIARVRPRLSRAEGVGHDLSIFRACGGRLNNPVNRAVEGYGLHALGGDGGPLCVEGLTVSRVTRLSTNKVLYPREDSRRAYH